MEGGTELTEKPTGRKLDAETRVPLMGQAKALHDQGLTQRQIADQLSVSQPTVCVWLRKVRAGTPQERAATKIRAELVCCEIFGQMEALYGDLEAQAQLRKSKAYHAICYYGEWAARLAEQTK